MTTTNKALSPLVCIHKYIFIYVYIYYGITHLSHFREGGCYRAHGQQLLGVLISGSATPRLWPKLTSLCLGKVRAHEFAAVILIVVWIWDPELESELSNWVLAVLAEYPSVDPSTIATCNGSSQGSSAPSWLLRLMCSQPSSIPTHMQTEIYIIKNKVPGTMAPAFDSSIQEEEAGRSLWVVDLTGL